MGVIDELLMGRATLEVAAFVWFVFSWVGYTYFSEYQSSRKRCLSNTLHRHREIWMKNMMTHDNRVADVALIANLERSVSFFASTSLIVIAGALTLIGSLDRLQNLPVDVMQNQQVWGIKLVILIGIFIYAFFKFTWSLRQYGFASVMIGSAPNSYDSKEDRQAFGKEAAMVISRAAHAYNLGLRSYYFALAFLVWFVSGLGFITSTAIVVWVLYRREFKSRVLKALSRSKGISLP